ncbi:MAG: apolipoprotein N-acyltransferase [Gammaproteobacteria bacterium]|nr:apolipoprotein N-acyltransferase [Gammaproteobacteria bacterium]
MPRAAERLASGGLGRRILPGIAATGAGGACALAFAPYELHPLAPLALLVLFRLWKAATRVQAFRLGYLFGIGLFGTGVSWLHISINLFGGLGLLASAGVTFILIAYLALFPALAGYAARFDPAPAPVLITVLVWPAIWVLTEWARAWLLTGFPWLLLGYSQTDSPLGSLAPLVGVLGISWATAVTAGLLLMFIHSAHRERTRCGAALLVLFAGSWLVGSAQWAGSAGTVRSVALIQGAVPLTVRWRPELLARSVDRYVGLTGPHWKKNIIVWPETAIPAFSHQVPELLRHLTAEAIRHGSDLYAGFPSLEPDSGRYFNGLLLLGAEPQAYNKRHLVPFGEFTPLAPLFRGFAELLDIPLSNFSPGQQAQPLLRGNHGPSGVSICYEDAFGDEVIEALPAAEFLINVSNDGWFGDSAAPHQHLQMARMRARETGRYMLRATNSGVSAIIAPDGSVVARGPQFEPHVLTGTITLFTGLTPYARFGNWPVILTSAAVVFIFVLGLRTKKAESAGWPGR